MQQFNPTQLQMLESFVGFLRGQQNGTIALNAEYSAGFTESRNNLRKDVGFIEKSANAPVHLDENAGFLTRDEANKR